MTRTLFSVWSLGNSQKLLTNQVLVSANFFNNYEYFFFQSAFWSLFSHRERSQSNQEQCSLCCSSPCFLLLLCTHYRPLRCFSTYFRKLKEIAVLRLTFPDYVISCDYDKTFCGTKNKCENKNKNFLSSPGIGTGRVNKKINFLGERDLKSKFLSSFFIIPIIWLFLRYTQTCLLVFICIHGFIVFPTHEG